ncbi:non-ribosomal peptide synthetase/type I polyketide synthase [Acidisphaera sp. L21]|uniref:non-ribosomal peptide synthetase/type I polyketide synthase n=1 Tax=Acidisphaera sp. L21 TaxID=1641851 RepID=UPI00131E065C|nr:non-ribosomal peptide synthetase/type I polyketide synthase [Acidisphaera sp. L21]
MAITGAGEYTYAGLAERVDAIARAAWQAGLRPGGRAALMTGRSAEAVAAMLAVLQVGAAYVPVDPGLPPAPLAALLADADPALILADHDAVVDRPVLRLDLPLADAPGFEAPELDANAPAYVMYTSGSTGTPKGVVVPGRGILRLVMAPDYIRLGADDVILQAAPLGFDASTLEIYGALLNGGTLAILPDAVPSLDAIGEAIARHGVTMAWLTSGLFHAMVEQRVSALAPLRQLLAGGDVLSPSHVARALAALPDTTLINGYGPTENTTFTCCYRIPRDHGADVPVPIGRPIRGTDVQILGEDGQPVAPGEYGELCAGGDGVALGYLNRPDLTARAFRPGPDGRVLYHTGDRARLRADGVVEFGGRTDRQVKIRGKRVALDEMEGELRRDPAVQDAAILMQDGRAAAYVTGTVDGVALRRALLTRLPEHMVPATITVLDAMPLTKNGKLDRKALPAAAPGTATEGLQGRLAAIWRKVLGRDDLPVDANLFDGGASSIDLVRAHANMVDAGLDVTLTDLFAHPSISSLTAHLEGGGPAAGGARAAHSSEPIAIVGMAARLPGAENLAAFWRNLCDGVESIRRFALDELQDAYDPATRESADFVAARPILDGIDQFEPGFFGMSKRDAELTDPQQRLFMEIAWEALESAGYDPANYAGRIGVFAGSSPNSYLLRNVLADRNAVLRYTSEYQTGSYGTLLGAGADFMATRIAYKLDLRGPAITVATACSTSLVAIAQGCAALRAGDADMVLAGGASITLPQHRGYLHEPGGLASADGHVRPFDAAASGTVFGSGAGVVLLKRLSQAVTDGDHIHAVIAGIATNNDGASKVGFTAPSVGGQIACIADAHAQAGFATASIGYVEAHGTATPLGDPIEFAGLSQVFGSDGTCVLGSVKGNVGHLDAAAGVTGLMKAVMAVEYGVVPGTLHYRSPNPAMTLDGTPFRITAETQEWSGALPRRAAVSAFGVGGTNAHAVLAQAPDVVATAGSRAHQVLVLSARSQAGLAEARARLAEHLASHPAQELADVAYTLQSGRRRFGHRAALFASDAADAIAALEDGRTVTGQGSAGAVAFLFPGQGSQYADMGLALYRDEAVFRAAVDRCAAILQPLLGLDLRRVIYPVDDAARDALIGTAIAQPALFTIGYATARLWMSWGITPGTMLGHSVGEFVAACLAGVFTLEDALGLIAARGRLMAGMPGGAMLAVRLPEAELVPLLGEAMDLAAVNAPSLSVAAGSFEATEALEAVLTARGVMFRRLHTSHAFHSRMMDAAVDGLQQAASRVMLSAPAIPFVSGVTGLPITAAQAMSPDYWAGHCRAPVRFAAGLDALLAAKPAALLECGPGRTLSTLALQGAARGAAVAVVPSLPDAGRARDDHSTMAEAITRLVVAGIEPDWTVLHSPGRRRVPLPTTPWDRIRCWIDEPELTQPRSLETTPPMDQSFPVASDETLPELIALFEDLSGDALAGADPAASFLQLGFDSLFLGTVAQQVRAKFSVAITFRQLMGDLGSFGALAKYVGAGRPARVAAPAVAAAPVQMSPVQMSPVQMSPVSAPVALVAGPAPEGAASLMQQQVAAMSALFSQQLSALGSAPAAVPAAVMAPAPAKAAPIAAPAAENTARFDAFKVVATGASGFTPAQLRHVKDLVAATVARTPGSKRMTAEARKRLADPRAAAGFRPEWKEMTYPIVAVRSAGPFIWDADGNEYVDLVNGFGQTAYGHAPAFVTEAVKRQLDKGFEIGPQAEYAGRVADRFCAMTGNERMTFCNTGSEAVMAAMRIARTVSGRSKIATFAGSYHGQFDEVLVKAAPKGTRPVAPGIPQESVGNNVVLEYASAASLAWIRDHADELAAVMFEPVQSRHPGIQPREFALELRDITEKAGICLIFDEVVTGFRTHPGGMQAIYGIRADLATYGKVVGGGMPVGILAGRAAYMDALDGGDWQFGDDSTPEAAVTFFAGTFVRHPLALAALDSVLNHIETSGPGLQSEIGGRVSAFAARLNDALAARHLPRCIEHYASWFYFKFPDPLATLFYPNMRLRDVHIQEGFPCFLTTTHGPAEFERIYSAFVDSLDALQAVGILLPAGAPIPKLAAPTEAKLTEAQMEVWLASQLGHAASCSFNEGISLHMRGALDFGALHASINRVFARHDALRARFTPTGDRMIVGPASSIDLPVTDRVLDSVLEEEARTPFDLVAGPPARLRLVRIAAEHHVLVMTAHHIICDGWSINTLLSELAEPGALPPALSFVEYASRQTGMRSAADLAWWKAQYATIPAALDLPSDRPRPALRSFRGGTRRLVIDAPAMARVKAAGASSGCTLFATMLGAVGVTFGRLADRTDVVIAVPAAAQSQLEDEVLVGHCANLLPMRATWTDETPFAAHLAKMRHTVLDAYEHQDCTLGTIVRALALPRDISRLPLTDVQFNLERLADGMAMPGLTIACEANPKAFVNFDLFVNAVESKAGLAIDCDYNADLFDAATVDRWLAHLRTVLEAVAADPALAIGAIPLLSAADRDGLMHGMNDTKAPLPSAPVHRLIEQQAGRTPDAVAARFGDTLVSYAALDARANQMARLLLSYATPGDRVAVMLDRTPDMLAVLLGAWKAGLTYVPLDPSHPPARLGHIINDAAPAVLVTDGSGPVLNAPLLDLRDAQEALDAQPASAPVAENDVAYVIYTSGSTGLPKGVAIGHMALGNLLLSMGREPGIAADDVWLAVTTISFDIAGLELWGPLVAGAQVVVASRADAADGHRLRELLGSTGATIMQATPATWRLLLETGWIPGPLRMLCGGEALPRTLADRLLADGGELWNMYGPTETTIWSAVERVGAGLITVGHPIANTVLHVLDAQDRLVPVGVPGHLHIGGAGLAEGYRNKADMTAERFIADPLTPGETLYRTGDSARKLPDGRVQVLGRIDSQIKLRGYRLEAGEVEHALTTQCGLAEAAVALRDGPGGDPRLVAWVMLRPGEDLNEASIRATLRSQLPEYMVPAVFMQVDTLPLTPNGKVDRGALPNPAATAAPTMVEPPRSALERTLAGIWSEVLHRPVGRNDDLLAMGADSIQLFQITARANAAGVTLLARDLLQHRTVAAVAAAHGDSAGHAMVGEESSVPSLKAFRRDRKVAAGD